MQLLINTFTIKNINYSYQLHTNLSQTSNESGLQILNKTCPCDLILIF